jgi:hypothetical protein
LRIMKTKLSVISYQFSVPGLWKNKDGGKRKTATRLISHQSSVISHQSESPN